MTEQVTSPETIQVQEYGLPEFLKKIQQLVKQGFELDLDSNLNYPQQYGTMFTAGMLKIKSTTSELVSADERVLAGGGLIDSVGDVSADTSLKVDGRTKQAKAK
jgi:hypothetical protein